MEEVRSKEGEEGGEEMCDPRRMGLKLRGCGDGEERWKWMVECCLLGSTRQVWVDGRFASVIPTLALDLPSRMSLPQHLNKSPKHNNFNPSSQMASRQQRFAR